MKESPLPKNKKKSISDDDSGSVLSSDFLKTVSHGPGVYQMLGKNEVLYVGKARDLRKRLSSYARYKGSAHSKTAAMLARVRQVATILTTTEKEALILESSLIKKHRPRYNVILRDDKNYPLIKVTVKDVWPKVVVTRRRLRDGNRYFGPFASTASMRLTLKLLHSMFPLRRCKTVRPRKRPCLNFQMGRCLAPCAGLVSKEKYHQMVEEALLVLEGKNDELRKRLQIKMTEASDKTAFEKAAMYRDQIKALEKTLERQMIVADHHQDQDIYGIARKGGSAAIAILFVRSGMVNGFQSFFLADPLGEDGELLTETLMQYYSLYRQPPHEILLPVTAEDHDILAEQLTELRGARCRLTVPQRGKKMQLMDMAANNAEQLFSERDKKDQAWQSLAKGLKKKLSLKKIPDCIECLDISNLQGKQSVGSLVSFVKGEKNPSGFRHYRIREKDTPDDYRMMHEVLMRRLQKKIDKTETATQKLPDLFLLDGGKGQLNVAVAVLRELDLENELELAAIAKEKEDEGEKLFRPGRKNPILLPSHSPVLLYLMRIRDESHRFGITFHRKLRRKKTLRSKIDTVQGIGPARKKLLLQTFGSIQRLKKASKKELQEVPGIGKKTAAIIFDQLQTF